MRWLRRLIVLSLLVAVLYLGWSFEAGNDALVTIRYPGGEFAGVPLWLALSVAFGAGALIVGVLSLLQMARLKLVARRYRKTARSLEKEVHELRNLPLSAERPELPELDEATAGTARGRSA